MTPLAFSFDLGVADYVAMNMHVCGVGRYSRAKIQSALIVLIASFFFLVVVGHMVPEWGVVVAAGVALVYFVASPLIWRYRYGARLRRYYGQTPADRLLGAHNLMISPEGVESTGPYHRTFRAWPAVTGAVLTADQVLIYTIFGNVYIIPGRAVTDRNEVRRALEEHLPPAVVRDA